ncbi:unnamed protein product [Rhizoctonia solani]|uniref:Uncharacterized protein n=1 Tax=Rhizoctonia solani TaxID=456999 RepID=A0A8H3E5L3_9AGAM|nr:unnamed protein product [Rhizoctonia solani]
MHRSIIPGVGSPELGLTTFVSALRIATLYEHPQLREFAISKLQDSRLPAIQRIQLADELSIPEWESIALSELSRRPESIARDEADILGMARIVTISHKRDKKQRSQLHNLELVEHFKTIFTPDFFIFMMLIGLFCAVMSFIVELVSACFGQAGSVVRILGRVLNMIITVEY